MSPQQTGRHSKILTTSQLKRRLNELPKEDVIELFAETASINKEVLTFISVKLQGEKVILDLLKDYKERIRKEFYPTRGLPKLRVDTIKQTLFEMKSIGKGTICPFELLVFFCEVAVQYIHEQGDIFEDMGDCFTDAYEEVVQLLNEEKMSDLFEKYKDRVKAIVNTSGCECWGIHDSLEGSYSDLKWIDHSEEEDDIDNSSGVISCAAMSKWLKIPEDIR